MTPRLNDARRAVKVHADALAVIDAAIGMFEGEFGNASLSAAPILDALIAKPKLLRELADVFAPARKASNAMVDGMVDVAIEAFNSR